MHNRFTRLGLTVAATAALAGSTAAAAGAHQGQGQDGSADGGKQHGHQKHHGHQNHHKHFKLTKITAGTTTVTFAQPALDALTAASVTVTPIAPGAVGAAPGAFTFPIVKGRVVSTRKHRAGFIVHSGGLTLTKAAVTHTLSDFRVEFGPWGGASVKARVDGKGRVKFLRLSQLQVAIVAGKPTATANAAITRQGAKLLNSTYGTTLVAGTPVGTVSSVIG